MKNQFSIYLYKYKYIEKTMHSLLRKKPPLFLFHQKVHFNTMNNKPPFGNFIYPISGFSLYSIYYYFKKPPK